MRPAGRWIVAVAAVGLPVAGWTIAWFVTARQTGIALDRWVAEEKSRDRIWACGETAFSGFPLRLQLDCASPSFNSHAGAIQSASASRLTARSSVFNPFHLDFRIAGPMKLSGPEISASITWSDMDGALELGAESPDAMVRSDGLRVEQMTGQGATWAGTTVQKTSIRTRRAPDRAPGSEAQEVTISIDGLRAPPADHLVGNDELLKANLSAFLFNGAAAGTGHLTERLDRWSASGGKLVINSLIVEKGRSSLEANGTLSLDERRRPTGQISVRVAGVQPILARLNLPSAPLAIEGMLRGSNGRNGGVSLLENRTLPLELRNGRLDIGPIRTPVVIPPLI